MTTILKGLWDVLTTVIVGALVVLAVMLVGVRLLGFQVYSVLSGSMEPTYHTGSLIYVKETDYRELKEGDVITFLIGEGTTATHRIVAVLPDETDDTVLRYQTKGDANDAADGNPVHYRNVLGRPVFSIPYMGYVADFIQHPPGMYLVIAAVALFLAIDLLPELFASDKKEEREERSETV